MPVGVQNVDDLHTEPLRVCQERFACQGGIHDRGQFARLVEQEVRVIVERGRDDLLDAHERLGKDETFINLPGGERNLKSARCFEPLE